jgi:hypothetical protein
MQSENRLVDGGKTMIKQTLNFILTVSFAVVFLVGAALLLTGCEVVRYTAKCTLVQPSNCN